MILTIAAAAAVVVDTARVSVQALQTLAQVQAASWEVLLFP